MPEVIGLFIFVGSLVGLTLIGNLVCYFVLAVPRQRPCRASRGLSRWAYSLAQVLSVVRLPFAFLPYCGKFMAFFVLRTCFDEVWAQPSMQTARLLGDFFNVPLTLGGLSLIGNTSFIPAWLMISALAEIVRLTAEKGSMVSSAVWQRLPHRRLTHILCFLPRYVDYYSRTDDDRLTYLYRVLALCAVADQEAALKLAYFRAFRCVPDWLPLRTGLVRDVATGDVFIHNAWFNDPWLLIGQALRRASWLFDPRFLRRPFYYRTEANPAATRFVLQHALLSPPYAWYQFGHEIKAARYAWFFRLARWFDRMWEEPVHADGTYQFDPLLRWLAHHLRLTQVDRSARRLWTDDEVLSAVLAQPALDPLPTALEVAERYTYPLKYVEEVLYPRLLQLMAESNAAATDSGASHCG
jgi:hypothetical protein